LDNLTHSVAGLLLAEAVLVIRSRRGLPTSAGGRSAARVASVLANNLNDADFLYAQRWDGRLGYLLHHRGHTHTLPVALLLGLLVFLSVTLIWKWRGAGPSSSERRALLGLSVGGALLHIGMDFCNNYGVHPFWPFDTRWFYGDVLFIIEPWLWVLALPSLVLLVESRVLRWLLGLWLGFALVLCWLHPLVHWGTAFTLTLAAVLSALLTRRLSAARRVAFAAAGWLLVALVFLFCARRAERAVTRASSLAAEARGLPVERIHDVVITPTPGNPLCFSALIIVTDGTDYLLRVASVALWPSLLPAERCHIEPNGFTAGLGRSSFASSAGLRWEGEWRRPLAELRELQRSNCWAAAMLRFTRVPFWQPRPEQRLVVGDLRYDRTPGNGFAELHVARRPLDCPKLVPPWRSPREDVLGSPPPVP
jgi:inner membrane protein